MATSTGEIIGINKCDNLVKTFPCPAGRLVLTSHVDNSTVCITATDGLQIWKHSITKSDVFNDNYFTKFSAAWPNCSLTVSAESDCRLQLTGITSQPVDIQLTCVTSADAKNAELQRVIFFLADRSTLLECKLRTAQNKVESLSRNSAQNVFDIGFDSKKKKAAQKTAPKQVGMSVVNPGSKKRSAPKGVEFD